MNLGGRILVSTLLAVIVTAAAGAQSAPAVSSAEARKAIQVGYAEWAKARVALDMNTIERMLAPDFYFQSPDRRYTRQEVIDTMPSLKITRFDAGLAHGRTQRQRLVGTYICESTGRDQGQGWQNEQGVQSAGCKGWLGKIERQPMDPPIVRATGPATVAGESADRKLVMEFSSDVLRRSRFS
jgi:hypothetical protein